MNLLACPAISKTKSPQLLCTISHRFLVLLMFFLSGAEEEGVLTEGLKIICRLPRFDNPNPHKQDMRVLYIIPFSLSFFLIF